MARKQGWAIFLSFLLGALGASILWFNSPYFKDLVGRSGTAGGSGRPLAGETGQGSPSPKEAEGRQAPLFRFQMITDGKQVFLADLKEGRVWRYFHLTKDSQEEEGFLPLAMFYGGKPYYRASEVEADQPPEAEEKE